MFHPGVIRLNATVVSEFLSFIRVIILVMSHTQANVHQRQKEKKYDGISVVSPTRDA